METSQSRRPRQEELVIDSVLTTQPELGPSVPDGGYGWIVFVATLFFQALIPSLTVSFGFFLAFSKLQVIGKDDINPFLWDDQLMYTPLLFIASWTLFDPSTRKLISASTWPRLVATSGTCLTCAGLLFLWMGMAGYGELSFYPLAGIVGGIGASIQMSQSEILLAQYFRLKHTILAHISQAVSALGFIIAPIIVGHHVLNTNLLNVILWYQAIILQGLVCGLTFKKPLYMKSQQSRNYKYISTNPDDEEDIFSKNSRELQIKRQDSTGTNITIVKHEIPPSSEPAASGSSISPETRKKWVTFDEENIENNKNYEPLKEDWETFEEDEDISRKQKSAWEKFEDQPETNSQLQTKNLQLELSFAENNGNISNSKASNSTPMPLFADSPVNNNNTYSYDVLEQEPGAPPQPAVFMPPVTPESRNLYTSLELLRQPTFYKSLLTVMTTKFSIFVYYTLFPSYMLQEVEGLRTRGVASVIGLISITSLLFSGVSYWVNIDKKRRSICLWSLCWIGSFGYFMISDATTQKFLIFGGVQVTLSIATLQWVGMPLLGLTIRGETNKEFNLISVMTGCAFLFFFIINSSYKNCFRLMALLHFFTGGVWFSNYIYKRIMK